MCRRDLVLTGKCLFLIGRESVKKGPEKGKIIQVIKRKLSFDQISHVSMSTLQVRLVPTQIPKYTVIKTATHDRSD